MTRFHRQRRSTSDGRVIEDEFQDDGVAYPARVIPGSVITTGTDTGGRLPPPTPVTSTGKVRRGSDEF